MEILFPLDFSFQLLWNAKMYFLNQNKNSDTSTVKYRRRKMLINMCCLQVEFNSKESVLWGKLKIEIVIDMPSNRDIRALHLHWTKSKQYWKSGGKTRISFSNPLLVWFHHFNVINYVCLFCTGSRVFVRLSMLFPKKSQEWLSTIFSQVSSI